MAQHNHTVSRMRHAQGVVEIVGRSIIAGKWPDPPGPGEVGFHGVDPASGKAIEQAFYSATASQVDAACEQAWEAFITDAPADARADLLDRCAGAITDLGDDLIRAAQAETGLTGVRLVAERERTTSTLRMFARLIRGGEGEAHGAWMQAAIDTGEPARHPFPKPDIRSVLRPLGPVAVFGASNFPLAYSVAGGDTASAWAAGCPVVVKGHPSHPATSELVARAITDAVSDAGVHAGFFSMLQSGGERAVTIGTELTEHPCIRAVGFTGSLTGGMALARAAASRESPIPVFAEMGSTNPVFVLAGAIEEDVETIARRLGDSVCNANGQMCTSPGLIFAPRGGAGEALTKALASRFNEAASEVMLSPAIRDRFIERVREVSDVKGVSIRGGSPMGGHRERASGLTGAPIMASPMLLRTNLATFKAHETLHEEVFGPATLLILVDNDDQMEEAASLIQGSLTASIWASRRDTDLASKVQRVLEERAGRLIFSGVPTGVEVCEAMMHGGPYPASNNAQFTAVGPRSIRRWLRPIAYQNAPDAALPPELRRANPTGIVRTLDGELTSRPG